MHHHLTTRIICIGNRFVSADSLGMKVYDRLFELQLPAGIELIPGELLGLNLLPYIEKVKRVVFVDSFAGFSQQKDVQVLRLSEISTESFPNFGHSSGFPYLLGALTSVLKTETPEIFIIGCCQNSEETVSTVAARALEVAGAGL